MPSNKAKVKRPSPPGKENAGNARKMQPPGKGLKEKPRPSAQPLRMDALTKASPGLSEATDGQGDQHARLDQWSFAFNGSRPLQLTGRVRERGVGDEDEEGDILEHTSQIVQCTGRVATTKSGTAYVLGKPALSFDQLRKQLWISSRTGQLGRDDGSSVPPLDESIFFQALSSSQT